MCKGNGVRVMVMCERATLPYPSSADVCSLADQDVVLSPQYRVRDEGGRSKPGSRGLKLARDRRHVSPVDYWSTHTDVPQKRLCQSIMYTCTLQVSMCNKYHTTHTHSLPPSHSPTHLPSHPLTHPPIHPPSLPPSHPPTHPPTFSPTHPSTHLPSHPPTHLLSHLPTHPHPLTLPHRHTHPHTLPLTLSSTSTHPHT